jgi:hypothetical protein
MKSGQRKKPKSVRRAELAAAMGGLIPGHEFFPPPAREAIQAAGNAKPGESVFDRIKLWDEVNGNADLLRKLATLYFEETPRFEFASDSKRGAAPETSDLTKPKHIP